MVGRRKKTIMENLLGYCRYIRLLTACDFGFDHYVVDGDVFEGTTLYESSSNAYAVFPSIILFLIYCYFDLSLFSFYYYLCDICKVPWEQNA